MKDIKVALIDSGCSFNTFEKLAIEVSNNTPKVIKQKDINHLHGDTIAKIIDDDFIKLYDIQVFQENLTTSPLHIYGALEYLLDKDIDIISMSLGLTTNYKEIKDICLQHLNKGCSIIASFPRSGQDEVYPASYKGVLKITADGRCDDEEISIIDNNLYGANPHSKTKGLSGSSIAVAKFTKKYSKLLSYGYEKEQILKRLKDEYKPR